MTSADPMAEIRASFFVECEELIEALHDGLQALGEGAQDDETIHVMFRAVHSIKGGAGAFGFESLVHFAHHFETAMDSFRAGEIQATPDLLDLFLRATDHLSDIVQAYRDDLKVSTDKTDALLDEVNRLVSDDRRTNTNCRPQSSEPQSGINKQSTDEKSGKHAFVFDVTFRPTIGFFETGHDVSSILAALETLGDVEANFDTNEELSFEWSKHDQIFPTWSVIIKSAVDEADLKSKLRFLDGMGTLTVSCRAQDPKVGPEPDTGSEIGTPQTRPTAQSQGNSVVRVDVHRVERLVNLVGELVINQAMLTQSLQSAGLSPHSDAMYGLEEFQRLTRDIQDSVMMIRAQPIKSLFRRMARVVREAAASTGKDVKLVAVGEATEVDKTVIEQLVEPLTHMIRNAVDHGIEPAETRLATQKTAQGIIRLSAEHRSGRVLITVSDDGQGINRDDVLKTAVKKGLVSEGAVLTEAENHTLLFMPGFSTAQDVSDLSGRGVGMDVVRNAIHRLGGRITISSEPARGTTFSISLPLTLAVLDGMVVDVAGESFVVPLNVVSETLTLSDRLVEQIRPGHLAINVRDGLVPLFDLGAALGYQPICDNFHDRVAMILTLENDTQVALLVDEVRDQRQVVIKGLDQNCCTPPGIAAATILGDGQIALILDPIDIIAPAPRSNARKCSNLETCL